MDWLGLGDEEDKEFSSEKTKISFKKDFHFVLILGIIFTVVFVVCLWLGLGKPPMWPLEMQEAMQNMTMHNFIGGLSRIFGY